MLQDIGVVMWKEGQELWIASRTRGSLIRLLVWIGLFGVMLPSQSGPFWLRSPMTLYFWVWFPMLFTSAAVTGAFAREREHHTLESLLATRLSDRAILWGKTATAVAYGWGLDLACALLGWVIINVQYPGLHLFDPALAIGGFVLSLLTACLVAGRGSDDLHGRTDLSGGLAGDDHRHPASLCSGVGLGLAAAAGRCGGA